MQIQNYQMVENTYEKYVLPDQEFAKDSLSSRMPEEIPLLFNTNSLLETETLNVTEALKLTTRFFCPALTKLALYLHVKKWMCVCTVCVCALYL